jgi:3-dehydrosphinganine reductase
MFNESNIIITGGSSGVGKILAKKLVYRGANLALIARDKEKLESCKEELGEWNFSDRKIEIRSADVSDVEQAEKAISSIEKEMGPPDVLINSAGILRESYFENQTLETFKEVFDINYFGTLHCIKATLPHFKNKGRGRIVNIASLAGLMGVFGYAAYCSSKHAICGLTSTLRAELLPQNIQCHIVCPPEFESPKVDEINTYRTEENKILAHTIPVLKPAVVADAIIHGIEKNRYMIIPGAISRFMVLLDRLFPALGRKIVDIRLKGSYKGPGKYI